MFFVAILMFFCKITILQYKLMNNIEMQKSTPLNKPHNLALYI